MVDKITKELRKIQPNERKAIKKILSQVKKGYLEHLDIKKLKGTNDIYRVRKRNFRIIFQMKEQIINILTVERRNDNTYS